MIQRGKRPIRSIGEALEDLIETLGIKKKVREYDAVLRWEEVVGEQIARATKAERISKGVLVVRVQGGPWRNELHLLKADIIQKLNTALQEEIVKDIRFI